MLAYAQGIRIAELSDGNLFLCFLRERIQGNSDHSQIRAGICSLEGCLAVGLVDKLHAQAVRAFDHMVVGDDQKLVVCLFDDNT